MENKTDENYTNCTKALAHQKREILKIVQKEIAQSDKYEIARLEKIRIEISKLGD